MPSLGNYRRQLALLKRLGSDERGEDIVEYGLVFSCVSLAVVGAAILMGTSLDGIWQVISEAIAKIV